MPESRVRRKAAFTAPPPKAAGPRPNPRWWVPVMVGLMVLGLVYIVVFYLTQQEWPIKSIGVWNLGVGFGLMMIGFGMTTNWR